MKISFSLFTLSFLFSLICFSQNQMSPIASTEKEGDDQMNGIAFKDYAGFEDKYKLMTVRYRTDSGEQRFVFANDIAFRALQKDPKNYPDGAVFTKIGVATTDDPAFLSSKVPGGTQRIQIMVRDQKKYKDTGGWGYAIFSPRGRTLPNDPKSNTKACYACHQLVPERGQVFSQAFTLSSVWPVKKAAVETVTGSRFAFTSLSVSKLPLYIQNLLNPSIKQVRLMGGPLRNYVFTGTLDEIRPELIAEAVRSKQPALFWSLDKRNFTVVGKADALNDVRIPSCPSNKKAFASYWSLGGLDENGHQPLGKSVFLH